MTTKTEDEKEDNHGSDGACISCHYHSKDLRLKMACPKCGGCVYWNFSIDISKEK